MRSRPIAPPAVAGVIALALTPLSTVVVASVPVMSASGEPGIERLVVDGAATVDELLARGSYIFPEDVDPGIAPEGDAMLDVTFTPDGSRFVVAQRETNNVTVYDWSTMAPVATVGVGTGPGGVACTADYAVVACGFSDEAWVIDLGDYSVAAVIATGEQPWVVRVSPDGSRAFVACDVSDTCEIIDLTTLMHAGTIEAFPIALLTFSFAAENGRSSFSFSEFEVSPDGAHLLVPDLVNEVRLYDTTTGALVDQVTGIPNAVAVGLSADGSTLVALDATTDPGVAYQVDLTSRAVTGSVVFPTTIATRQVAVNQNGSKCYVGLSGNQSAIGRFATSDAVTFASTFTAFWIGSTADHRYAISGQNRFSIVDFDTETMVAQVPNHNQSIGAVSPVLDRVASFDPLRNEVIHQFDVATPAAPVYRGTTPAGEAPEGDCPYRVALHGGTAVVGNVMSETATILHDGVVSSILHVGERTKDAAISADGTVAVVCAQEAHQVAVIDLLSETVDAIVPTNLRPAGVVLTPDGTRAYVANIQSNTVSVVSLAGASSTEIAELPVGTIGVTFAAFGVTSGVAMSPTGEYVLVAASFDDNVKVISTATNSIVATLPVGDFPLSLAFNADGSRAIVTNYQGDSISLLAIDGAASSVVTTTAVGDGPLRVAFSPAENLFGVAVYSAKTLVEIDDTTGAIADSHGFASFGNVIDVGYDDSGLYVVLLGPSADVGGHVIVEDVGMVTVPTSPSSFAVTPTRMVVTMPGPDVLTVIDWDGPISTPEVATVSPSAPFGVGAPRPQPARGTTHLDLVLGHAADVTLRIVDVSGRERARIAEGRFDAGRHDVSWDTRDVAPGVYWATLEAGGRTVASRRVVVAR